MTTRGQFNTKNPTIKRILKEASELANHASADYHAEPLEDNLFEWHFTLRGPPAPSPYADGLYHGRIILPAQYPLRPPSFRFVTPTGRFEVNREICLSISGHHEESWQPAWGIRTALVAIRSFMDTDAKGQVGGIDSTEPARRKMAAESAAFRCAACAKTNADIMREREELARELEAAEGARKEEEVPEELRLAYREDLAKEEAQASSSSSSSGAASSTGPSDSSAPGGVTSQSSAEQPASAPAPASQLPPTSAPAAPRPPAVPAPTRTGPTPPLQLQQRRPLDEGVPAWIDKAIYGVLGALAFMILRKFF
ncbi:putative ubiquitin-conjugating enzyme e2 j1 protein [Neofusicoccum parvum]|nr:putative ubiquitin-conjugating enzyme e2 j1 protein [Neofusicoccum parvum]